MPPTQCAGTSPRDSRERTLSFANYLRISRRSLNEVVDCARSARLKGYISPAEQDALLLLARRLHPGFAKLIAYLDRTPDPVQADAPQRHRHS